MNLSKTLASTAAALAVVGSIGIAYAQTTSDPTTSTPPATEGQAQSATPSTDSSMNTTAPSSSTNSMGTTSTPSTDSSSSMPSDTTSSELPAQADRG